SRSSHRRMRVDARPRLAPVAATGRPRAGAGGHPPAAPPRILMATPSVLAVSFFSSPGAVADNFHSMARALARQSDLSVITSRLIANRPIPGARDACYMDVPKHRPLRWLAPGQWL